MSRINTAALQQPSAQGQQQRPLPEVDISPDSFYDGTPTQQQQPQQPAREVQANSPHFEKMTQQLEQLNNTASQQATLSQLLADPDISKVLAAKQSGKRFTLQEEDPNAGLLPKDDPNEQEPNWEELGQDPRKMSLHLTKSISKELNKSLMPSLLRIVDSKIEPMNNLAQQVGQLAQVVQGFHSQNLQSEIDNVRNQNPDQFDRLRPAMTQLVSQYPGMKIKQLYALACAEAGLPLTPDRSTQTERPTSMTANRPGEYASPHQEAVGDNQIALPQGYQRRPVSPNASVNFDRTLETLLRGRDMSGLPGVVPGR